jgi:hypothetical protein
MLLDILDGYRKGEDERSKCIRISLVSWLSVASSYPKINARGTDCSADKIGETAVSIANRGPKGNPS